MVFCEAKQSPLIFLFLLLFFFFFVNSFNAFLFCFYFCPFSVRWPTSHFIHKSPAPPPILGVNPYNDRRLKVDTGKHVQISGESTHELVTSLYISAKAHTQQKKGEKNSFCCSRQTERSQRQRSRESRKDRKNNCVFQLHLLRGFAPLLPFLFCFLFHLVLRFFLCDFVIAHI